ncbi:MAG: hypothetical protein KA314_04540 [Chloroflexi bacterium]|nr:hypothetical protein [Chloroflexota bacterium]
MHATDLITACLTDAQKEPLPEAARSGICCVTGVTTETIARKQLFGSSFCDLNLLACPESPLVGVGVWYAFQFGAYGIDAESGQAKKRKKKPEVMSCWWTDGQTFHEMGKAQIRELVLRGTTAKHWAGWVTTTYKKHGALRSPVNGTPFGSWGFDDLLVRANDVTAVLEMWRKLRQAQNNGIGRTGIETLDIPIPIMIKVGMGFCNDFLAWARPRYQSPLYQFLVYLLPSQEELREGYSDGDI